MDYVAALFASGRIVTGSNHGEAFGKLSTKEQDDNLTSGFFNPITGKFSSDDFECYVKNIFLVRHSDVEEQQDDPELSDLGRYRAADTAHYLFENFNLSEFEGFFSHARRCQETAKILDDRLKMKENTCLSSLADKLDEESDLDFLIRLKQVLDDAPQKCIIVSHSNCIINLAQLASNGSVNNCIIGKCSITYVFQGRLKLLGKMINEQRT